MDPGFCSRHGRASSPRRQLRVDERTIIEKGIAACEDIVNDVISGSSPVRQGAGEKHGGGEAP